ncbi:MAG TPA: hypothetical protein VNL70_04390, partial [Tepidisphaeraceae bacterium]|nr:hypothetical protein [Tepidisphaeraceae bacterium]
MSSSPGVTRTGSFPIGFRRGWSDWQKKSVHELAQWASSSGFALLDLMNVSIQDLKTVRDAGLDAGSIDLLDFGRIMTDDPSARKQLIAKNIEYIRQLAPAGVKVFFTCIIPADPTRPRAQNYALAVECFAPIAHACAEHGAWLAVEGWPGGAPHLANLCCTPETV